MRGKWAGVAAVTLTMSLTPALATLHAAGFQPPRFTREQMEATRGERSEAFLVIYGTADSDATPLLR